MRKNRLGKKIKESTKLKLSIIKGTSIHLYDLEGQLL